MRERKRCSEGVSLLLVAAICLALIPCGDAVRGQEASQGNPRVQIIAPQNGTTFVKERIIPIVYQAWSPDGTPLIRAEAYVDGVRGDEGLTYNPPTTSIQETLEWDATFFRDGPHTITIRVFDARNRMGEASVTIYKGADTTKPKAEILSPKSGSVVKGTVAIIARFEDDRQLAQVGVKATSQDERRKHYILYAKGGVFRERVYEATVLWDTTSVVSGSPVFPDGLYILQAWAVDGQGQEGISPEVLVTVRNQSVEPVIQRPETSPRGGERPLAKPSYGAVIIARPVQPQPEATRTPPAQPTPEVSIKPAPINVGVRQPPNVELLATRLRMSETLSQLLSTPIARGDSLTRLAKGNEPLVAILEFAKREGTKVVGPVVEGRGATGATRVAMLGLPSAVNVGRSLAVEGETKPTQPMVVAPIHMLRPIAAAPTYEPTLLASAARRTGVVSKPAKPPSPVAAQLMPIRLPEVACPVPAADTVTSQVARSWSVKLGAVREPRPQVVSPIAGVSPVKPPSVEVSQPLISSRGEFAQVRHAAVKRATGAVKRACAIGMPSVAQLVAYGAATVKPISSRMPTMNTLPRQTKIREALSEQAPIAASPSYGRANVARGQIALPISTSSGRSKSANAGVMRTMPAALPSVHIQRGKEQPTVVITRRRASFTYTVQPGDTLCSLARKFGLTLRQLMDANALPQPVRLRAGQTLVIPRVPITVKCGGQVVNTDVQPYLLFGTALTPFRAVIEFAGGFVEWIGGEKRVTARWNDKHVHLRIDDPVALINGESMLLKPAPFLLLKRTIVPARLFERVFEVPVIWNQHEGAVEIGIALGATQAQSERASSQEAQK